jgi:hypothetical protein
MSDLADDLYQAYREGRTTLRFPEPPTTGPPPLTTPDLFRHIAEAVQIPAADEITVEDLEDEYDAGYRAGYRECQDGF